MPDRAHMTFGKAQTPEENRKKSPSRWMLWVRLSNVKKHTWNKSCKEGAKRETQFYKMLENSANDAKTKDNERSKLKKNFSATSWRRCSRWSPCPAGGYAAYRERSRSKSHWNQASLLSGDRGVYELVGPRNWKTAVYEWSIMAKWWEVTIPSRWTWTKTSMNSWAERAKLGGMKQN